MVGLADSYKNDFALLRQQADLSLAKGDYFNAEKLYRQMAEEISSEQGVFQRSYLECLRSLGVVHEALGDHAKSAAYHQEAIDVALAMGGETDLLYGECLRELAGHYCAMGDVNSAEKIYRQVLSVVPDGAALRFHATLDLACLYAATNRAVDALTFLRQAERCQDGHIGDMFMRGTESQRYKYIKSVQRTYYLSLSLCFRCLSASQAVAENAFDIVHRRKAVVAEASYAQRDAVLGGAYHRLRPHFEALKHLRQDIAEKLRRGRIDELAPYDNDTLSNLRVKQRELERQLARQIPEMRLEGVLDSTDLHLLIAALPPKSALIEYVKYQRYDFNAFLSPRREGWKEYRYAAFVVASSAPGEVHMVDLGDSIAIDKMITDFRNQLTQSSNTHDRGLTADDEPWSNSTDPIGHPFRAAIFDPLDSWIAGLERLFIVPDGELGLIPFEVLPTSTGSRHLLDNYFIAYLNTGRDLLRKPIKPNAEPGPPLVVADPAFDLSLRSVHSRRKGNMLLRLFSIHTATEQRCKIDRERTSSATTSFRRDHGFTAFKSLPGARWEGELVADIWRAVYWQGPNALKERLKRIVSPRILHIATHGFYIDQSLYESHSLRNEVDPIGAVLTSENPLLLSGIALAGANDAGVESLPTEVEDGILTAEEVACMDLTGTELVVLSLCDAGVGRVVMGEGVLGLRSAFRAAGAKALIISLWKVADVPTVILMVSFYTALLRDKLSKDSALRNAKQRLREVTIGELRANWLTDKVIDRFGKDNSTLAAELNGYLVGQDKDQPFADPFYWGGFVVVGDIAPLVCLDSDLGSH